jgi:micrococcal nuclease
MTPSRNLARARRCREGIVGRLARLGLVAFLVSSLGACSSTPVATAARRALSTVAPSSTGIATPGPTRQTSVRSPTPDITAPAGPIGPVTRALVSRVIDGDTIEVMINGRRDRVRYIGIDAPESVKPNTPVQPFALAAAAANRRLVAGRTVLLERDVSERDRFDRLLRYVWLESGGTRTMVNLVLVEDGFAHAVTFPPDVRYVDLLRAAERSARMAGRGLWAEASGAGPGSSAAP